MQKTDGPALKLYILTIKTEAMVLAKSAEDALRQKADIERMEGCSVQLREAFGIRAEGWIDTTAVYHDGDEGISVSEAERLVSAPGGADEIVASGDARHYKGGAPLALWASWGGRPCRKCGGVMGPGVATAQTYHQGDEGTCSPGGPGVVVDCAKCAHCGWSVTV